MALFFWKKTLQPQAGAEAYAFNSGQLDPLFPLFKGPGVAVLGSISALQPQPLYYPNILGPMSGIGGLIYDTNFFTPLMASSNSGS